MPLISSTEFKINERINNTKSPAQAYTAFRKNYKDAQLPPTDPKDELDDISFNGTAYYDNKKINISFTFSQENNYTQVTGKIVLPASAFIWVSCIITLPAGGFGLALGLACYVIDILSPKSTEALDSFKCALQQTDNDLAYFNGNKTAQSNNSVSSSYDMLSKLADLKERGALTEEEFNQEKEKLMKNMS